MSAMSKSFVASMGHRTCEQLFHPGRTCWQSIRTNLRQVMPGCLQYFLPIVVMGPITKMDTVTMADVKESFQSYWRICFCIYLCSVSSQAFGCLLNQICDRNYMPIIYFLPVLVANMWTSFMLEPKAGLFMSSSSMSMIVESFLMRDDTRFWRLMLHSGVFRTLVFMCLSALILHDKKQFKNSEVFWFVQPITQSRDVPNSRVCRHKGTCETQITSSIKTYLKVAVGLEMFRIVASNVSKIQSNPLVAPKLFLTNFNWRVPAFLVGYSTLYRALNCLITRNVERTSQLTKLAPSIVSASVFYFYPNRTILAHAIVSSVRVLWSHISDEDMISNHWCPPVVRRLATVHWSNFIHIFGIAYLFHLRALYPYWCPATLKKTTSLLSGYNFDAALHASHHYYLGFK